MKRDFKTWMLLLAFGLPVFLVLFIAALYFGSCGFEGDCADAALPPLIHTPIPTLIPVTLPAPSEGEDTVPISNCTATAWTLLSAWVSAGYPETDEFKFLDSKGANCEADFSEIQPLFNEANLWYTGSLACTSCHSSDITLASAKLDLSSYAGIVAGSRRSSPTTLGNDILGGGIWEQSVLNEQLFISGLMPLGRVEGAVPDEGPSILAGQPIPAP
jgi:hypothetical protein